MVIDERVIGMRVNGRDGAELGTVKEVDATAAVFKVDASMQPDYWLSFDAIQSVSSAGVLLSIAMKDLEDEAREEPVGDRAPRIKSNDDPPVIENEISTLHDTDEVGLRGDTDTRPHRAA